MKGKTLCIVIALMVLSIGAIIGAGERILTLGGFSSTLNGVPVEVMLSRQGSRTITTMQTEDLLENWADHNQRFVRFMGVVESVYGSESKQVELKLENRYGSKVFPNLFVYPLDAPRLPTEYQEDHVYEFTGFLVNTSEEDELDRAIGREDVALLRVYAFEIRHHGSLSAAEQAARLAEGD